MTLFIIIAAVVGGLSVAAGAGSGGALCGLRGAGVGALLGAVAAGLLTWLFWWMSFGTVATVDIKVVGKERIAENNDGKWMIYAAPGDGIGQGGGYTDSEGNPVGETFENTDAWFHGKTRSTDLYRQIEIGKTYRCKVNGFRSGFLSIYRNILKCDGVKS